METGGRDMILLFLTRNESKQHSKKKRGGKRGEECIIKKSNMSMSE